MFLEQLEKRQENQKKFESFVKGKILGDNAKFIFNAENNSFFIEDKRNTVKVPDVISGSQILHCSSYIKEDKEEVFYLDSNNEKHSFFPPYYAYSYDFFVRVSTSISYIGDFEIKINNKKVDNGQEKIIKMGNKGTLNRIIDKAFNKNISMGKTSNIDEVKMSNEYVKYEDVTKEIVETIIQMKETAMVERKRKEQFLQCPWCDSVILKKDNFCKNCGGRLYL